MALLCSCPELSGSRMLTVKEFSSLCLPYAALILIEPTIVTKEVFDAQFDARTASIKFVVAATSVRRDTWANKDEAFTWLSKRFPWNLWDSRVVRLLAVSPCYTGLQSSC